MCMCVCLYISSPSPLFLMPTTLLYYATHPFTTFQKCLLQRTQISIIFTTLMLADQQLLVCMYESMNVCMSVCLYVCMYLCTYACMHANMHLCPYKTTKKAEDSVKSGVDTIVLFQYWMFSTDRRLLLYGIYISFCLDIKFHLQTNKPVGMIWMRINKIFNKKHKCFICIVYIYIYLYSHTHSKLPNRRLP